MKKDLDWLAAQAAQTIITNTKTKKVKGEDKSIKAGDVDNLITKSLGVLQENGVYAALLYLCSRSEGEQPIARQIRTQLLCLIFKLDLPLAVDPTVANEVKSENAHASRSLQFLTESICNDLDRLLLVKQLWEQTLIYARYGAKAQGVEEEAAKKANKVREEPEKAQSQP